MTRAKAIRSNEERNRLYDECEWMIRHVMQNGERPVFPGYWQYDDICQELQLVLLRAIELWRPEKGPRNAYVLSSVWKSMRGIARRVQEARPGSAPIPDEVMRGLASPAEPDGHDELHAAIGQLTPREQYMIERMYGLGREQVSQKELAAEYGISRVRVRQIVKKAQAKLRRLLTASERQPLAAASSGS